MGPAHIQLFIQAKEPDTTEQLSHKHTHTHKLFCSPILPFPSPAGQPMWLLIAIDTQ